MADRNLPEPDRAGTQLIERMLSDIAALKRRAWSGGLRMKELSTASTASTARSGLLSITAPSGRWAFLAHARAEATLVGAHAFNLDVTLDALDDGAPVDGLSSDPAVAQIPGTGVVKLPLIMFGQFNTDQSVTLTLEAWGSTALATTWQDIRLLLSPW
jgi:hypothetical protein